MDRPWKMLGAALVLATSSVAVAQISIGPPIEDDGCSIVLPRTLAGGVYVYNGCDVIISANGLTITGDVTIRVTNGSIRAYGTIDCTYFDGLNGAPGTADAFPTEGKAGSDAFNLTLEALTPGTTSNHRGVYLYSVLLWGGQGGRGGDGFDATWLLDQNGQCLRWVDAQNGFPGGRGGHGGNLTVRSADEINLGYGVACNGGNGGSGGNGGGRSRQIPWQAPGVRFGNGSFGRSGGHGGNVIIEHVSGAPSFATIGMGGGINASGGNSGSGGAGGSWYAGQGWWPNTGGFAGSGGQGWDGADGGSITVAGVHVYPSGLQSNGGNGGAGGSGGSAGIADGHGCGCSAPAGCSTAGGHSGFPAGRGGTGGAVSITASTPDQTSIYNMSVSICGGMGGLGADGGSGGAYIYDDGHMVGYPGRQGMQGGHGGSGGTLKFNAAHYRGPFVVYANGGIANSGGWGGSHGPQPPDCPQGEQGGMGGYGGNAGRVFFTGVYDDPSQVPSQNGSIHISGGPGGNGGNGGSYSGLGGVRGRHGGAGTFHSSTDYPIEIVNAEFGDGQDGHPAGGCGGGGGG